MTENPHPLSETAAVELWEERCGYRFTDNTLAALRAAFDAGREHERATPADPHHDPRPWQDCTREDIREGDLVEAGADDILFVGVAHHQDEDGDWFTADHQRLTDDTNWDYRRIPAPTPAALDPLAENTGKVLRDVVMHTGEEADVAILAGSESVLADWSHGRTSSHPARITAFTTDDRATRYTREGDTWTAEALDGEA